MRLTDTVVLISDPTLFEGLGLAYTSRAKASNALGISSATFARLERGGTPSDATVRKLAVRLSQIPATKLRDAKTWTEVQGVLTPHEIAVLKAHIKDPKMQKELKYALKRWRKTGDFDYPFGSVIIRTAND